MLYQIDIQEQKDTKPIYRVSALLDKDSECMVTMCYSVREVLQTLDMRLKDHDK